MTRDENGNVRESEIHTEYICDHCECIVDDVMAVHDDNGTFCSGECQEKADHIEHEKIGESY